MPSTVRFEDGRKSSVEDNVPGSVSTALRDMGVAAHVRRQGGWDVDQDLESRGDGEDLEDEEAVDDRMYRSVVLPSDLLNLCNFLSMFKQGIVICNKI
jgi:hypothetical protein